MTLSNTESSSAEQISSLADSQFDGIDIQNSLNALVSDQAQRNKWERYHLIRNVMQNEYALPDTGFAARVSSAIQAEPTIVAPSIASSDNASESNSVTDSQSEQQPIVTGGVTATVTSIDAAAKPAANSNWRRNITGLAVAASVAMVSLIGLNMLQGTDDAGANNALQTAGVSSLPQTDIPVELVSNTGSYWVSTGQAQLTASNEKRLNMFLSQHIENSPTSNVHGMLPYSRLAGYDEVRNNQQK